MTTERPHAARALVAPILIGAARVVLGVLWLIEGVVKLRAGFGVADIGFVVDGAASNPRVPGAFAWFAGHVMGGAPALFGFGVPLLEVGLGLACIVGVLPRLVAAGSVMTLMLYWLSDQLIGQYPVMVVLSAAVLTFPLAAARLGLQPWLERRWRSLRGRRAGSGAGRSPAPFLR